MFLEGGYNCAESVLGGVLGEVDTRLALASGFGGGIGGTKDVCGAATGAVMALGAVANVRAHGDRTSDDLKKLVAQFLRRFEEDCGGLDCADLVPLESLFDDEASRKEYFAGRERKLKCAEFVAGAERLALDLLAERGWADR